MLICRTIFPLALLEMRESKRPRLDADAIFCGVSVLSGPQMESESDHLAKRLGVRALTAHTPKSHTDDMGNVSSQLNTEKPSATNARLLQICAGATPACLNSHDRFASALFMVHDNSGESPLATRLYRKSARADASRKHPPRFQKDASWPSRPH